jgi:hypothetical protein
MKNRLVIFASIAILAFLGTSMYFYAQGKIGPNIQNASLSNIDWALKNVSMMNFLNSKSQLKNQKNIYYISRFLESIKKGNNN